MPHNVRPGTLAYTWDEFVEAAEVAPIEGLTRNPTNRCLLSSVIRTMTGWEYAKVGMTCAFGPDGEEAIDAVDETTLILVNRLVMDFLDLANAAEREPDATFDDDLLAIVPTERVVELLAKHGIERKG